MDVFKLNPLHYVSLPGYAFDCWLMSRGAILDTLQDKQMLYDFFEAKRAGICGIKGDRLVKTNENNKNMAKHNRKSIWYIDASNLYGYAMMQKSAYKDFKYCNTSLDKILNTPDDSCHSCYIICDNVYSDETKQISLMPNKRKINGNEFCCRDREKGRARTEKLILYKNKNFLYMVFHRMLKFWEKMGAKLTK